MSRITNFCIFIFFAALHCTGFSQTIMRPVKENKQLAGMMLEAVDPLQKVFPEVSLFPSLKATADVARGEHATFQYAFRSSFPVEHLTASVTQLDQKYSLINRQNVNIGFVDYVRTGKTIPSPPPDKLTSPSGFFPDPIIDTSYIKVRADYTQPIWVSINIPKNTPSGEYHGQLNILGRINNKNRELHVPFSIHVYPVTIDSSSLWVTNWFAFGENQFKLMNNGNSVIPFSEKYWELLKITAQKMADYNQNVVLISPLSLAEYSFNNGNFNIDFSHFDRYVETFRQAGALKRIEGGHIGGRMGDWNTSFGVSVPVVNSNPTVFEMQSISNQTAKDFYKQFIPALLAHLKEKGWDKIYVQHIADEPTDQNYQSYIDIASFFKNLAPGIPVIDAVMTKKLNNIVDIWVPILDVLDKEYDYFEGRQIKGNEVWTYTCTGPQGNYANRFIELPLIKTRILHWINFRYNISGYLHWGFNHWNDNPFDETVNPETEWPGGDCYIVYPGYKKLYSSIRLEAMRDGIMDYELLKMLSQKDPDKAKEICNQVIYSFDRYNTDIKVFMEKRKMILELLSK
jgi:hypothetical protein